MGAVRMPTDYASDADHEQRFPHAATAADPSRGGRVFFTRRAIIDVAMTTSYSQINPDSPWRWVPLVVLLPFCGVLFLVDLVGELSVKVEFASLLFVVLLMIVSWFKVGSGDASTVAQVHAEATGGVRVNSHPILSRVVFSLGCVLLAILIVQWIWLDYVPSRERVGLQRLVFATLLAPVSILLLLNGWRRPWDLKVVERDAQRS